ncbi:MAG: methylmalonate-semialdehyde dehydrogenase [Subtercola sp.]|nr:methylmalonate-semialdehyde dehydrogenase [Subtercola sp.]
MLSVVRVEGFDDALDLVNASLYGNGSKNSLFGDSHAHGLDPSHGGVDLGFPEQETRPMTIPELMKAAVLEKAGEGLVVKTIRRPAPRAERDSFGSPPAASVTPICSSSRARLGSRPPPCSAMR